MTKPDTAQQQFGGTIGGPIVQDRAHFFFSLERVRIDEGITVNIPARPDLNGTTTEETRVWNTMARCDHGQPNHTWGSAGCGRTRRVQPDHRPEVTCRALGAREEDYVDQTVVGYHSTLCSVTPGSTRCGVAGRRTSPSSTPASTATGGIRPTC